MKRFPRVKVPMSREAWEVHNEVAVFRNPLLPWLVRSYAYEGERDHVVVLVADPAKVVLASSSEAGDEVETRMREGAELAKLRRRECVYSIGRIADYSIRLDGGQFRRVKGSIFPIIFVGEDGDTPPPGVSQVQY